jgi:hypothetical protein
MLTWPPGAPTERAGRVCEDPGSAVEGTFDESIEEFDPLAGRKVAGPAEQPIWPIAAHASTRIRMGERCERWVLVFDSLEFDSVEGLWTGFGPNEQGRGVLDVLENCTMAHFFRGAELLGETSSLQGKRGFCGRDEISQ